MLCTDVERAVSLKAFGWSVSPRRIYWTSFSA